MALTVSPDLRYCIDIEIESIEWAQFRGLLASPAEMLFPKYCASMTKGKQWTLSTICLSLMLKMMRISNKNGDSKVLY